MQRKFALGLIASPIPTRIFVVQTKADLTAAKIARPRHRKVPEDANAANGQDALTLLHGMLVLTV
jgi:hypothetical protein